MTWTPHARDGGSGSARVDLSTGMFRLVLEHGM